MKIKILFSVILLLYISKIGAQNCMNIGVNFHDVQYWSAGENAFKDQMKQSGEFIGFYDSNWDDGVLDSIPRDADGYPNAGIPYTTNISGVGFKDLYVRKMISADGRLPLTQLVFLYDGNGTVQIQGDATITNQSAGRIEFNCTGTGNIYLVVNQSDTAPNHLRNFRLVSIADETSYQTQPWKQTFLDRLAPFSTIRVMDWNQTNGCTVWDWNQRTTTTYNCQNTKSGVAYEHIIDLCNSQQKDLWLCVPHMADTNYIMQMANLFKNNLDPNLTIYLEYSNEVWNPTFDQFFWVKDDFTYLDPNYPHNPLYDNSQSVYYNTGLLAKRAFELWYQTFGADSTRVNRVVAAQGGNVWIANEMISAIGNGYDYIAPDWYFGASEQTNFNSGVTAQDVVDSCRVDFYENRWQDNLDHYTLAQQEGKNVICYEGGQHITANGNASYFGLQAFYDAQTAPAMYTLYDDIIDTLRYRGAELIMAYTLGEGNSPYGSWGHIANVDTTPSMANAPKYMALINNLPNTIPGCNTTSIENSSSSKENIVTYPNPTNGIVYIEGLSNFDYKIYSTIGQLIKTGSNQNHMSLTELDKGLYFIKIFDLSNKKTYKTKVIKE